MLTPVGVSATLVSGLTSIEGVKLSFLQPVIAASGAERIVGVQTPGSCQESARAESDSSSRTAALSSLGHDVGNVRNGCSPAGTATQGPPMNCWWQWLAADGSPHNVSVKPSVSRPCGRPGASAEIP